jgi:hypothetical protein
MAKNNYAKELQQRKQKAQEIIQLWTGQCCLDAMTIALNEEFGIGADRLNRLNKRFNEIYGEALRGLSADVSASHVRRQVDERLEQICGPNFVPWPERYAYWEDKGI